MTMNIDESVEESDLDFSPVSAGLEIQRKAKALKNDPSAGLSWGEYEKKFENEPYEILKRCSEKRDLAEWKEWRGNQEDAWHLDADEGCDFDDGYKFYVCLDGADFSGVNLEKSDLFGALLRGANFENASLKGCDLRGAQLQGANLTNADLSGAYLSTANLSASNLSSANLACADFHCANLQAADLTRSNLVETNLGHTKLQGADFTFANLTGATFSKAELGDIDFSLLNLDGVDFSEADLKGARMQGCSLRGANLSLADLRGVDFSSADLQDADFTLATVDGETLITLCDISKWTCFSGVGLRSAKVDPGLLQLLEHNVRWIEWQDWYREHWMTQWSWRVFWAISDYGRSTRKIIFWFILLAVFFAALYYSAGPCDNLGSGWIQNLFAVDGQSVDYRWVPFRALYFSVVTMTTLGFGDMYANAHGPWGHVLLTLQVLLGYVMLGALITRFAVLFTSAGPDRGYYVKRENRSSHSEFSEVDQTESEEAVKPQRVDENSE